MQNVYVCMCTGVCHADDLQYLFPVIDGLFPDKKATESDKRVSEILTNMWVNFARTGLVFILQLRRISIK